ncbi:hypothetical protein AL00_01695 [Sphingobium indicum F2]|uniref:BON domain-containing protein n=1 Tax=Sphingobium indicum F2 TaxID=1450518 RepID=A0A8E0WVD7_9SPHN|nr:BON domain-containing protein [Sphingobium indicum]KER38069.1 hypothetical protein AL00_01695 [Sphingobium indicum F2]
MADRWRGETRYGGDRNRGSGGDYRDWGDEDDGGSRYDRERGGGMNYYGADYGRYVGDEDRRYTGRESSGRGYGRSRGQSGYGSYGETGFGSDRGYGRSQDRGGNSTYDRQASRYSGNYGQGSSDFGGSSGRYSAGYQGSSGGYGGEDLRGGEERGWWDRAGDEVRSWFGDDEAERRRRMDEHRGRGPKGYARSDERIREDVCDRLSDDPWLDASNLEVSVANGEVTLSGSVSDRSAKRRAEDCVENVSGIKHVQNNLRVQQGMTGQGSTSTSGAPSTIAGGSSTGTASETQGKVGGSS